MTPDEIRRLYRRESPATEADARDTIETARTDPEEARRLITVMYSLSVEDRDFAMISRLFSEGMLLRLIYERAEADDAYALECSNLIADLLRDTMRPLRGKPGKNVKTV